MPLVVRRQTTRPAHLAVAFLAVLGALSLAGCGGDDKPEAVVSPTPVDLAPTARIELARGIYKENDPGGEEKPLVDQKAANCIADALVGSLGVDGLVNMAVIDNKAVYRSAPRSVPAEYAEKWISAFEGCLDLDDYMLGITRAGVRRVAPAYGERDAKWAEARTCLGAAKGASHAVMLGELTAKPKKDAPTTAFADCVRIAYPKATP